MSRKIIGVTVGTTLPKPNFKQTDPTKGDYIKNKPDFEGLKAQVENIQKNAYDDTEIRGLISDNTSDITALEGLVGDTKVATQISTAIGNIDYPVDSVNGKTGAVVLSASDVGAYTTTEVDTKLSTKSDSGHTHSAYVNQNAFSKVTVGSTTIEADNATDTLTLVAGSNVTLTPDASGDKITIAAKDTTYTHPNSGVTAGTYKSVTVNAQGHVTAGTNPTTLSGYGITDAASKTELKLVSDLVGDTKVSTQIANAIASKSDSTHNHDSAYDAKGAADTALASAKTYADQVKNDLLNGAGTAYDTLKELGDLINDNQDAIDALEIVAASKADASVLTSHTGNKSNPHGVTASQVGAVPTSRTVNGKALSANITLSASDVGADASGAANTALINAKAYTDAEITEWVGDKTVSEQISTAIASKSDSGHTHDDRYYTESEINTKLSGKSDTNHTHSAYANQNAFSNVKVGSTTISADTTTDTLTLVAGSNVTITPDATNDKVTIAATDTVYTHPNSGVTAGTYKSVTVNAAGHVTGGSNPTTLSGYGITDAATKTELNNLSTLVGDKKVSEQISTAIAYKSDTDHTHNYAGSSSAGGAANSVKTNLTVKLNGGSTEGTNLFTYNGSTAKTVNITPSAIGAAASSHGNHVPATEAANNAKFLRNDNTWQTVTPANIGAAASSHGTHVSYGTSATAIGSTASAGSASTVSRSDHTHSLSKSAVTTALGYTPPTTNTTYDNATTSKAGLMSAADKVTLNNLDALVGDTAVSTQIDNAIADMISIDLDGATSGTANTLNADTLGGYFPSHFASNERVDDLQVQINSHLSMLAKLEQVKPEFANSIEECTDTTKLYVLPDGYIYAYMLTENKEEIITYKNWLKYALEANDTPYNGGQGWKANTRLNSSGVETTSNATDIECTGFIPFVPGDVIRFENIVYKRTSEKSTSCYFEQYSDDKTLLRQWNVKAFNDCVIAGWALEDADTNIKQINTGDGIGNGDYQIHADARWFRISADEINNDSIITINEEIGTTTVTTKEQGWANTGHAFVPADYEDRIIAVEEANAENEERIDAHETRIANLESGAVNGVPSYVVAEAEEVIDKVISAQGNRTFTIASITDMHYGNGSYTDGLIHACQAMQYIDSRIKLDAVSVLGDYTDGFTGTGYDNAIGDFKAINAELNNLRFAPNLRVHGNHDHYEHHSPILHRYITAYSDDVVWGSKLGGYFYRDFDDFKLRIICLNTSESSKDGLSCSVEQYNWFADTLDLSDKEDTAQWQTLILSHHPLDWFPADDSGYLFWRILNAYLNGTSWRNTAGTVSCDFTGKNGAKIVGNIHGHIHNLLVRNISAGQPNTTENTVDVIRVATPEACYGRPNSYNGSWEYNPFGEATSYPKTQGTAEDTAFCIYCIDLDSHTIKAICYGAGYDREISY